ncbi:MAG: undecaprenyldiphospho-muramoylpentapeptide beta-N-acetylglucosaminyltransferase [Alkalibacterium sp.]|nr:undecaprenyldiphospho-muramoylpentapeptide beta-N-acetylglucosaminyltransferase [Alkalibacterium sp.]TVP92381.1 MAG: undecaprenyldiphospho-muramoylpentapeptide beta-N-acetylglucosaminyltransferase [Alkalibacterium sp.]
MKILVTGGGTGGHIYPALALIKRIKETHDEAEFLYVGTYRGLESEIVPKQSIKFEPLKVEGFKRKLNIEGITYNVKTVWYFIQSIRKAKKIIRKFNPDVVIGTGGYVSAPVCYASSKLGIPTVVHEQNSVAGITNKFLAKHVSKVAICFEDARSQFKDNAEKVVFTGNPRAQEVADLKPNDSLKQFGLDPEKPTIVIFGGSRGAAAINNAVVENCSGFNQAAYQTLFITGRESYDSIIKDWRKKCGEIEQNSPVKIVPYVDNLPEVFASVSLVVARSGATTLAELTALGVPSVLIPSPNVTEDHQTRNAKSLSDVNAAVLINENELKSVNLINEINRLMNDRELREQMSEQSRQLGVPDASDRIINLMSDLLT